MIGGADIGVCTWLWNTLEDLLSDFVFSVFTCWNPSWLEVGWNMAGLQT